MDDMKKNMNDEKKLDEKELEKVTGGSEDSMLGIYRCTVCGWEWPIKTIPYPKMSPCKKCGGKLRWYEIHDEL